jgi:hypothetical protein
MYSCCYCTNVKPNLIRATSHTRLRGHDQYTSSPLIGGKGGAGPSSLHTMREGPIYGVYKWMHDDGCKVYMDSSMATNGPCIMVTWTICKNHLLEVGLTHRIGGTYGTPNAHNRWLILFYHAWGLTWLKIHWDNIWLKAQSHMTSHYTWGSMSTRHDFGGGVGTAIGHFFWALTISWSRLLAHVWSVP